MNVGGALVPRPSPSYKETLAWLYSTQRFGIKLGLESVHRLFAALNLFAPPRSGDLQIAENVAAAVTAADPKKLGGLETAAPWQRTVPRQPKIIHVAGTNGKGSVCAMIDSVLRAQGYRTGLFTSPHLVTFRERIRVNGEMISDEAVARGLTNIRGLAADWEPHPTFFEIVTALALQHFGDTHCEFVVLETGLGGRLDATNATRPVVSVLTPIGFDHQEWLGDTLGQIAAEKAGIIKANTPVVSAPQLADAEQVIRARARECHAPLTFVKANAEHSVALAGAHQRRNAALAIAALRRAQIEIADDAIARGLASVEWPARFQRWDEGTIIDGAHNPAGAEVLAQTWRSQFGDERATIILAILADKDADGICRALAPVAARVLFPKIRSERAMAPQELREIWLAIETSPGRAPLRVNRASRSPGAPSISTDLQETFSSALSTARTHARKILITGSLHFAGEALAELRGEPAAFEECAQ